MLQHSQRFEFDLASMLRGCRKGRVRWLAGFEGYKSFGEEICVFPLIQSNA